MQEYKLIDKFDGYKLLDRNGQVIYVQTDDVKKQLSLGNVRIYGLKLSESGILFRERTEEVEKQIARQLKANLQWEGTLFGVPLKEFKADLGDMSHGPDSERSLLNKIWYGVAFKDHLLSNALCKINSYDEYKNGLIWVYDPDRKQFIQTEYFIALANEMWHESSKTEGDRKHILFVLGLIGENHVWYDLKVR